MSHGPRVVNDAARSRAHLFEHTGQFSNTSPDFNHIDRCESKVKALSPDRSVSVSRERRDIDPPLSRQRLDSTGVMPRR